MPDFDRWNEMQRWGVDDILGEILRGSRRICFTLPTGGGKTRVMQLLIEHYLGKGKKVSLYTNRKLLIEQTSRVLETAGLTHGVRAAGHEDERWCDLQVSSIQTEYSRAIKKQAWGLHEADLVLIDEAHLQKSEMARKITEAHIEAGAVIVGFTATPIDLADMYDVLITAGTVSQLRECGALVLCHHYGPDEPDLREIRKVQLGEDLSENQVRKVMGQVENGEPDLRLHQLFGRVVDWFKILNPERKPTILFAPGVEESRWFAREFCEKGIPAAHIDGQEVWINGTLEKSSRGARNRALDASRSGAVTVLCNRFVLREGIDAPWLAHGIFATVFGSLQSYLQSGGRLLRSHPGVEHVTLQDHGGNWWRHGSLNADRLWRLDESSVMIAAQREDRLRAKTETEPCRCPRCGMILSRRKCPCGYEVTLSERSRPVVQTDGTMRMMTGDIFKPRRICNLPEAEALWRKMYYRAKSEKWDATFRQAAAKFAEENHWAWPSREMPLMPIDPADLCRKVRDVPMDRLRR